ncbi:MAG: hypothetical protein E7029_08835 [Planctomycetaceae bacterium]|nr:hypothetical protein [Planctomycetaceae bacterium]
MGQIWFRSAFWALILTFCASFAMAEELLILSYNVRNGRGLNAPDVDLERPAGVIRTLSPDIAGIQELDQNSVRCGNRDIPQELGKTVGMKAFFAPAIDFQGGKYGIATLAKTEPLRTYSVPLPGKEERRVLQVSEFETFVFFNTHLSLTEADRMTSAALIDAESQKFTKPVFLCGDFNAMPDSKVMQAFFKNWDRLSLDACTFPANAPRIQIDYILVPKGHRIDVLDAKVLHAPTESDHCPIYVKVKF